MRAGPDSTSGDQWGSIALLTSYLLPNTRVVDKSTLADIFGEAARSHTQ